MTFDWDRFLVFVLLIIAVVFCLARCSEIAAFFGGIQHIGGFDREQHKRGVIAAICLFAIFALLIKLVDRAKP